MDRLAHMVEGVVVAMGEDVLLQMRELAFDAIEPRGVGWRELQHDIVLLGPAENLWRLVCRKVVQNDMDATGVLAADGLEEIQEILGPLALFEMAPKAARPHIVGGDQMAHAVLARVSRALAVGLRFGLPGASGVRSQLQRAELVDADHGLLARLGRLVEALDGFFFLSNSGSSDCFQVLVRWREIW